MKNVIIKKVVDGRMATNTYFLYREGESEAVAVDPAADGARYEKLLREEGLTCAAILLTHGHFDHILGVKGLIDATEEQTGKRIPVYASEKEAPVLADPDFNLSAAYAMPCSVKADRLLKDGEEFTEGGMTFRMFSTPGHTPGGACFYLAEADTLLSGDTLFEGSVGRTDFPGGSMSTLVRGIREKILTLPEETVCLPGHGDKTTVGFEKQNNPFL